MSSKSEAVTFEELPTIEHIMPQNWKSNWPLPAGLKAIEGIELLTIADDDPRAVATRKRETALQSIGNLTLLSTGLNSAQSNLPWSAKRPEMMKHSLLPLNQPLFDIEEWDENAIKKRGEDLFTRALRIWPRAPAG
jgi:hypothetical protein